MKRFLMFSGQDYYPLGGWSDFDSDHDTMDEARRATTALPKSAWKQIVDTETQEVIWETE